MLSNDFVEQSLSGRAMLVGRTWTELVEPTVPNNIFHSYVILAIVPKTGREDQCYKGDYTYRGDANREVRL